MSTATHPHAHAHGNPHGANPHGANPHAHPHAHAHGQPAAAAPGSLMALPAAERKEIIRAKVLENSSRMTIQIARELGVPETEVIRALPDGTAWELDATRWQDLVKAFESLEQVHVIASNGAVTLECFGQFGNFSVWGDYFNVQTKSLDMHIRSSQIAAAFAVVKPSHMDGVPTVSFQFYDHAGTSAFKVFLTFGSSAPTKEKMAAFEGIRDRFLKPAGASV
jgi:putative hemin transport protein